MLIYCISGLGADHRAFVNLKLGGHKLAHLPWPPIQNCNSLEEYARSFVDEISQEEPFALLGLSFGGMIAAELAKLVRPDHLFLISTITGSKELPWYFRFAGKLKIQYIIPSFFFANDNYFSRYIIGAKTKETKRIYHDITKEADTKYYKKAIQLILKWNPVSIPDSIRIHGSDDKLLPIFQNRIDHYIKGGGHLMIIDRGSEISKIINDTLVSKK